MLYLRCLMMVVLAFSTGAAEVPDSLLFDFETPADLASWKEVKFPELKTEQPAPKVEMSQDGVTSGKSCLTITFDGGQWPMVGTTTIGIKGAWKEYQTIKADLTSERGGVAYLGIGQSKGDAKGQRPDWEKTLFLRPGRNEVTLLIRHGLGRTVIDPDNGEISSFLIGMYEPAKGQVLKVDNVRLSKEWPEPKVTGWNSPYNHDGYSAWAATDYAKTKALTVFKVAGTDLTAASLEDLSKGLKPSFVAPVEKSVAETETEFRGKFEELKKTNPGAVLAIFRDGEKGFDPANPEMVYAGWKNTYLNCHEPDGPNEGREAKGIKYDTVEAFMRHRRDLMQLEFSSIPKGSKILAARLVVSRVIEKNAEPVKANLWVAEPCNREWSEEEANCYYYAKGKNWMAVSGMYYGEDADFSPVFLLHGPAAGPANSWDFIEGVKYWVNEGHENHGFFLYGDSGDYMRISTRKAKEVGKRPAVLVAYVPGK